MRLILSRKGSDTSFGSVPSPIFPDGRMVSLPIPDKSSSVTCGDILRLDFGQMAFGLLKPFGASS